MAKPDAATVAEIIHHFGGIERLMKLLGCRGSAIRMWKGTVPRNHVFAVMVLSGGRFNLENMPLRAPIHPEARKLAGEVLDRLAA